MSFKNASLQENYKRLKDPASFLNEADYEEPAQSSEPVSGDSPGGEKYRGDVAGIGENVWSNNAMEYDTPEEVKKALDNLSMRWFGYDMARVVPASTPKNEPVDPNDPLIYQNFRKK